VLAGENNLIWTQLKRNEMSDSTPKGPQPQGDDTDTQKALECFQRGDFQEALRRADAIIAAVPEVGMSWRFKGECLFSLGRYLDAVECFDRAGQLGGPGTEEVFLWKAICLANAGQRDQAIQWLHRVLAAAGPTLPRQLREQAQKLLEKLGVQTPPPLRIAPDDPLMGEAHVRARATVKRLRSYFAQHPRACSAKVPFRTDGDVVEHLWGQVEALTEKSVRVTLRNRPVTQKGPPPRVLEVPLDQIDDWEVHLPDGTIRGGFTTRVMFVRAREQWGDLPPDLIELEGRYVDEAGA
jgi:uncharacterized protein YegJ (DUF2314 family)